MTDRQKRFCEEYLVDWNATRAAIAVGYSEKTAGVIGSENLKKPYIQEYIEECKHNLERLAGISKLRNLKELAKIAYANISEVQLDWDNLKNWDDIPDHAKACISQIEANSKTINGEEHKTVKIRFHNKPQAIQEISKMMGYNEPEKFDLRNQEIPEIPKLVFIERPADDE